MASFDSDPAAGDKLTFFFDFASPYAYMALDQTVAIAAEFSVDLDLRATLVWAILKEQGIPPPLDSAAREAYFKVDMPRSAAFFGVPYSHPAGLPMSSHLAARLWLGHGKEVQLDLARAIFHAFFVHNLDIRNPLVLIAIAREFGTSGDDAIRYLYADETRAALTQGTSDAIVAGAPGVPFLTWRGEKFFGADRLGQLKWRMEGAC